MKYRSRTEIASRDIRICYRRQTKTKIMYKAFLSYAQLKEYLSVLQENDLLSYQKGDQTYKTTQKGLHFLDITNSLQDMMEGVPTPQG